MKEVRKNGLSDEQEAARIAGLKALGLNPMNHPGWFTAYDHKVAFAGLHQKHRETLDQYRPKVTRD